MTMQTTSRRLAALTLIFAATAQARAQSVADFYRGRTITLVVSSSAGGGYDTLARAVARRLPAHVPGAPAVIVRNMPGAGGIVAANYLANVAQRDGTIIAGLQNNTPFDPLFGAKEADYDPAKMLWLGTPSIETGLLAVWRQSPVKTLEDARRMELTAGAPGAVSTPSFYARLFNDLLGFKIKVIPGFPGQTEAFLAMERGEIDMYGLTMLSALKSTKPDWLRDGKLRILMQYGPEKNPELGEVPFARDLVTKPDDRLVLDAADAPLAVGRPFVAPPGLPPDRAAALRRAFAETFIDPEFVADATRQQIQVDHPRGGAEVQEEIERAYRTPAPIVARLRRIEGP